MQALGFISNRQEIDKMIADMETKKSYHDYDAAMIDYQEFLIMMTQKIAAERDPHQ